MKHRPLLIALTSSLVLACTAGFAAEKVKGTKAYKWVDKNGVTQYGDTVPPEYAQQGSQALNGQGVPLRDFPRQLSPAEADAAQKQAAEEARQRQHDSFLLTTYTNVSDIEQLRDERVALIDGQMELARSSIAATDQRLGALQTRLAGFKPYSSSAGARRVPDQLAEEVVRTLSERRSVQTQLEQREKEKADQLATFSEDIARYRALTERPRH